MSDVRGQYEGLGGWLILVGIGIVVTPIRTAAELLPIYVPIFTDGTFQYVTTPGTEAYHPLWAVIILSEVCINALLFLGGVYLIYLFFRKREFFPRLFIYLAVFGFVFVFVDAMSIKIVLPSEPIFDTPTITELAKSGATVFIWVPYMLVSERVKATFTR
ncbi:DUF2569 domain-containing protein [Hoeflea sp. WL0058]|uniref:DUF2569 domain-containing protein n=1 Tax=Flavimaribacter sediminis TaxID=2865987 RepID=A0AAE3D302_9HYPH|nr:DUF2569 domain-containing protein [Flavimaribacter sediminis]MBW8640329.1 DUF2569 domain-containing protein [Flavimaribacter sediminis]